MEDNRAISVHGMRPKKKIPEKEIALMPPVAQK